MHRTTRLRPAALAFVACWAADVDEALAQASRSAASAPSAATPTWRLVEELRYDPDGEAEMAGPGQTIVSRNGDVIYYD